MLCKDEWLSQYFKGGAYKLSDTNTSYNLLEGFVYIKIPSDNFNGLNDLIKNDFKLIEVSVLMEQKLIIKYQRKPEINIGFVQKDEQKDVLYIAKDAFQQSRFYQDKRISQRIASQIKKDWVNNYFLGSRGDQLIVARVKDKVIGFLLLINKNMIDLIAVSPNHHRKGIASAMIDYANQTIGLLTVGTQLNNKSSIAMYEKCGFQLKQAHFVLHKFYGMI